ncbi:MAG: hypothetical protein ACJ764_10965 [Solirubrobacteraceae bacterium]
MKFESPAPTPLIVQYLDVVLVVAAAPILLLMGVSAVGYAYGAGAWLILRAVGVGVDRMAETSDARRQISIRLGYMLGRLFLLALAVILARRSGGKDAGLAALLVVVIAFTVQLAVSAVSRPRGAGKGTGAA